MGVRPKVALAGTLLLAASLLTGVPAAADQPSCAEAGEAPFDDRSRISPAHVEAVDCLHHLGIVRGYRTPDGRVLFAPRGEVTRAQFTGMLHRMLTEAGDADRFPAPRRPRFGDVPAGHTFDDEIHVFASTGIVRGIDDRTSAPGSAVRRDQSASLLLRAAAWSAERDLTATDGPYFSDTTTTIHREAIDAAFEFALITGTRAPCGDAGGAYSPDRTTERQQVATLLVRALEAMDDIRAGAGGEQRGDPECPTPQWEPRVGPVRDYARSRDGSVSFAAIGTDDDMVGHRADTVVPAASTLKVMFLVAYLRQPDVRDRALRQADRDLLEPMIRRSANEPATEIADLLGPGPMERLAERAGMRDFSYTRPWGQSRTSARDQARFMRDLPTHLPSRHRDYGLQLLTEIVRDQRWGIGEVETPGWSRHFKGGWGSGSGAVDHQIVLLRHGDGTPVSVTVMTTGNPSHEYGKTTLHGVLRRLLADLP
jgi:hypothetical protein